ncbi:DUF5977 domain-containing protein [Chryseobacterium camelliae]|uniref:DUF5977 domain-containing protein n=1 Tax=Chryseobacterium camelliae TaxID=1265445 RepID=A0ABY7QMF7_9FLAO|nr:DUF5977 domain-containing protein [Chryseobacterium camelliae]WBV59888.1 DUF5977 domain-containing protein [Chryseobacterium camelliae]
MKKKLILFFSLSILSIYGQTNSSGLIQNSVNSTAPKSPDAAALFRYIETPVSLYTGVPNINIPLYTIKEGDIEIPISISYHAGGIKVTDEASSVGLGWSLNAGGRVSHIMAGANDFSLYGYYNIYPKTAYPQYGGVTGCPQLPWNTSTYNGTFYTDWFMKIDNSSQSNSTIYEGYDFQPDLFSINLPNKSYKAYLDMAKTTKPGAIKFLISEQENINFKLIGSPNPGGNYNFQVTDENGLNYYFDQGEITTRETGWNTISGLSRILSKIEDTKGNKVNFYSSNSIRNARLSGCKNTRTDFVYAPGENLGYFKENGLTDCTKLLADESYLEKIEFTNGKIEFNWTAREDVYNSKKLSSIKIYNNYKLIKQYDFNYDYFIATDNLNTNQIATWLGASNNNIFTHRLRLLNITESITNEKYSFEYNSTYNLPNKLSYSSDFWGYFNGQNNSDTFIPDPEKYIKGETVFNVTSFNKDDTNYWYEESSAPPTFDPNNGGTLIYTNFSPNGKHYLSDRRTSLYSTAGMLSAINYPTGGKTEYEYEPNTFSNFPMQSLINDNTIKEVGASHLINNINGNTIHTDNPTEFKVIGTNIKVNIFTHFGFNYLSSVGNDVKNSFWTYIKDKSTGAIIKKIYNPNVGSYQITSVMDSVILQSGTYEIGMSYNSDFTYADIQVSGGSSASDNTSKVKYVNEKSIINGIEYDYSSGAGVRIKKIKTTEKTGAAPIIKNYIYDEISNNGTKITSNGNLAELPKFYEIENRCYYSSVHTGVSSSIYSNPGCFMSLAPGDTPFKISVYEGTPNQGASTLPQGNHVGYSKVTEQIIGKGKIENYFKNDYNQSCLLMAAKGASLLIGDGDLLKQSIYDKDNMLLKEVLYNYRPNNQDGLNTYTLSGTILEPVSKFVNGVGASPGPSGAIDYASYGGLLHTYSINLWQSLLESTTTKEYFPAGSNSYVETKSLTTYNNKYLPSVQKTTYPDTSFSETTYNYAQEKGNQLLIDKNMVSIPLETITTQTSNGVSKILSKTETLYPTSLPDAQTGSFALPKSVKSYDLSNSSSSFTEVTLDKYDHKGNLIQYTTKDGIPVSVIWGYNATLPIAKIEGAQYDNIAMHLNDIISAADYDALNPTNEQALLTAEDNLRKNSNLANYQITTYSHDPLIGVTSVTPPSGIREYYQYDTTNRLEKIVDNSNKILKEFNYHYANNSTTVYHNVEKNQVFTRNNCPTTSISGTYNYVVPAGAYFSTVSQLAADQKALDDINTNGQNIANQNGSCTPVLSCPFTFSSITANAQYKYNGTTTVNNNVSFNVSFSAYGIWQNWTDGLNIGTIEGDCKPTSNKEIIFSEPSFNRQWRVFIDTAGNCTLKLLSGTVDASSTNPILLQFQYQK